MAKNGPILLIEDDVDDKEIFEDILKELKIQNELIWYIHGKDAFEYLKTTPQQPFLIFCDVNLPHQTGMDLKKEIDEDAQLRRKSIPFVFYSTSVDQATVNEAYTQMTVQGFFQKENNLQDIRKTIKVAIDYWLLCKHPNS